VGHVALSVVGADRLPNSRHMRAQVAHEDLVKASRIPHTILRSTQFFDFLASIAQSATDGQTVRLSPALVQPVTSDEVAIALVDIALGAPVNSTVDLAGPERFSLDELVRRFLAAKHDARRMATDIHARYFGAELNDRSLVPGENSRIGPTRFGEWLTHASLPALFSPGERAALAWTEVLTELPAHGVQDDVYKRVRTELSEKELSDLTFLVMATNAWNRVNVAF
jgi:uncharacterized protein YbjT (DUF2867 family)